MADETWDDVHGPPTREGAVRLVRVWRQVKDIEEKYSEAMHERRHGDTPGWGKSLVCPIRRRFESSRSRSDPAAGDRRCDVASGGTLAPSQVANLLERNLKLQQSGRRWRRLSMESGTDSVAEFGLVAHRHEIASAAEQLLEHAALLYIAIQELGEDVRTTGIETGSDRDLAERMLDEVDGTEMSLQVCRDAIPLRSSLVRTQAWSLSCPTGVALGGAVARDNSAAGWLACHRDEPRCVAA